MPGRRSRRIKNPEQLGPPVQAGGSQALPESAFATRTGSRLETEIRRINPTATADGVEMGQGTSWTKQVAHIPRRRGKLHHMLDMPLDVIMEICVNLQLRDILYLSRLSKAFRAFFTRRSVRFLWKCAVLNVPGLPPCPEDLNEISYARLLFDAFCHDCNNKNCSSIYWGCRVRLCKECYYEENYHVRWPFGYAFSDNGDVLAKELLGDHYFELNALLPTMQRCDTEVSVHYSPQLNKLLQAWKALPRGDLEIKQKEFIAEYKRSTAAILKTIPALEGWYHDFRTARQDELSHMRLERQAAILEHLKEDGWQPEIDYLNKNWLHLIRFAKFPGVRKPQALTPRIWSSLRGPLTKYMEEVRKDRLHDIEIQKLKARLIELGEAIPEIASDIGQPSTTSYECEVRIPQLFELVNLAREFNLADSRPTLRILVEDYLRKRDQIVLQELSVALRREFDLDDSVDPLSLAIGSYFRCICCDYVFERQNAIHHICRHRAKHPPIKPDWMSDDYFKAIVSCLPEEIQIIGPQVIWSIDNFQPAFARVAPVIEACGFNVKTATVEALDSDKNLRLICFNHTNIEYVPTMTWRTAAYHHILCCRGPDHGLPVPRYKRIAEKMQESEAINTRLAEWKHRNGYYEYFCAHCAELPLGTNVEAFRHTREVHKIQHPSEEDWVVIRRDEAIPDVVYNDLYNLT